MKKAFKNILKQLGLKLIFSKPGEALFTRVAIFYQYHKNITTRFDDEALFRSFQHENENFSPERFKDKKIYVLTDRPPTKRMERLGKVINTLDNLKSSEIANSVFYLYFTCDSDALPLLRIIHASGGQYIPHLSSAKTDYRFINKTAYNAIKATWEKKQRLSYLEVITHENICEALELTKDLDGDFVEIGVYMGASASTALNFINESKAKSGHCFPRKAHLLDTFNGFDYTEAAGSSDAIWAGTHKLFGVEKTIEYIKNTLGDSKTEYKLHACNICDKSQFPAEIQRIAVANIDVDLYEPTLSAFEIVAEKLLPGGIIIAEDPASTPALYGALLAMEDFLATSKGKRFKRIFKKGQYFLLNER